MSLIAGSYEKYIHGFKLKQLKNTSTVDDQTLSLTPVFSYPAHLSPVKSVAVSGPVGASASTDDSVKLYDLATSSELGSLLHHTSSVTSLSFFTPKSLSFPRNLLAASDDGSVCIYDVDPFVHLKTVAVHKKGINDLAVHPSGRLALTVGRDSCFAMVNLVRGRRSFCCKLAKEATIVRYSLGGERFYMCVEEKVTIHEAEDAKMVGEFDCPKRILCATPGENGILFTGGEDRCIRAWDTKGGKAAYCIDNAHTSRVKGIVVLSRDNDCGSAGFPYLVASASSDGVVCVWDVRMTNKEKPLPFAEANTKSRITCLAGSSIKSFKAKRRADDPEKRAVGDS